MNDRQVLLAGDLGATNLRLALFMESDGQYRSLREEIFEVNKFDSLETVVEIFINNISEEIIAASFAVAGPVIDGNGTITNLNWKIEKESLRELLSGIPVSVVNDIVGLSSSIPILKGDDLKDLNPGQPVEHGTIAVIAPGTGLGEGFLVWADNKYQAFHSEGGHSDFAPTSDLEIDLLKYLQYKYGHVSYERICSGLAIPDIYAFFKQRGDHKETNRLNKQLANTKDQTPIIIAEALETQDPDPLCKATMDLFVQVFGAESGNLALKVMATGGVYLGGGIPPRILPLLKKSFMDSFVQKGRFQNLIKNFPVNIILHPQPALLGAARYGFINLHKKE